MESKKEPRSSVKRHAEYTNHDLPPCKKSSDGVTYALMGQTKPDILDLIKGISIPQTEELGIWLIVADNHIDALKREYSRDPDLFGYKVVKKWWGNCTEFDETNLGQLYDALHKIGFGRKARTECGSKQLDCLQQDHNTGPGLTAAIAVTDRNCDGGHVTVPPTTVAIYKLDNATRDTPQQLQLKMSNYNPWQHIKAVSANRIKHTDVPVTAEEEFRTTLSVVDASTGEMFRCLLQLTESSEVSASATDYPLCNVSVSIEIAPCKHTDSSHHRYGSHRIVSEVGFPPDSGSLKLRFSFSEANCMYAISFSIDSIISGDGKRCPGSTQTVPACVICTIRAQPVSMKREPVLLEFQKPLKGQIYRSIVEQYREKVLSGQTTEVVSLTNVVFEEHCPDIKVVALCYQAMAMTKVGSHAKAQDALDKAKVLVPMCINNILLLLKITRLQLQNVLRSNDFSSAHYYFESTKEVMSFAAPSPDTCAILSEQAYYLDKRNASKRTGLEKMYDQAIAHSRSATCQECTNILACGLYPCKALFHLKSYHPPPETFDEWEKLQPSDEDLQKAADCLSCVQREDIEKREVYKMEYYTAQADLHQWKGEFHDAYAFAQSANVYRCKYHNTDFLGINKRLQALPELIQSSSMKGFL